MLDRVLQHLPRQNHPDLLVGSEGMDDAGVFRVNEHQAIVQSVDFFTPIVDDAYDYGRIAATNSLSDIYAMGGRPITAMNIVAFPDGKLPEHILKDILLGASDICRQAGVVLLGGHTVSDQEIKFGLAVTGLLNPSEPILANSGAREGDLLLLTKPLGTGLISNAMMNGAAPEGSVEAMIEVMVELNDVPARLARKHGAHAATDVTGFGLLGHAREMALASNVSLEIDAGALPAIEGAMEIAGSGSYYSGGERRNHGYCEAITRYTPEVGEPLQRLMSDPQTSGGLLIALAEEDADPFKSAMSDAGRRAFPIGRVKRAEPDSPRVIVR